MEVTLRSLSTIRVSIITKGQGVRIDDNIQIGNVVPSVGADKVKNASGSAPLNLIWAWKLRASALVEAGALQTWVARRAIAAAMVKVCMVDI